MFRVRNAFGHSLANCTIMLTECVTDYGRVFGTIPVNDKMFYNMALLSLHFPVISEYFPQFPDIAVILRNSLSIITSPGLFF